MLRCALVSSRGWDGIVTYAGVNGIHCKWANGVSHFLGVIHGYHRYGLDARVRFCSACRWRVLWTELAH